MATPVYVAAPKEDNGKKDVQNASQNSFMAGSSNMTGTGITVLKEGEIAEYRKYGNGKDTSDDLAVAGDAQQVAKQRGNSNYMFMEQSVKPCEKGV